MANLLKFKTFAPSLSAFALAVCAGQGFAQSAAAPEAPALPTAPAPFVQTIKGTAVEFSMTPIPAGTLLQADPAEPSLTHVIAIPALYISTTEITWDLYDIFLFRLDEPDPSVPLGPDAISRPSKAYLPADRGFGHSGYPVISISFHGGKEFCRWLSEKTGRTYRLPTRDEWEYAARAGGPADQTPDADALQSQAWFAGNSTQKTHTVASKTANAWGLFDTLGNAAEWTIGPADRGFLAGGSFLDPAAEVNPDASLRFSRSWNESDPQIPKSKWWLSDCPFSGFRVVCEVPAEPNPSAPDSPAPSPAPQTEPAK